MRRLCFAALGQNSKPFVSAELIGHSGMNRVNGERCDAYDCVSTSLTATESKLSIDAFMIRRAIQIRWASTDLSVLETHPLTPGLVLNTPIPTTRPIPPLEPIYKIGLGLTFVPLMIACLCAIWGCFLFRRKRESTKPRRGSDIASA